MKYYEVFTDGMPLSIYQMKEEDRLKLNFNIKGDRIVEYCEPDKEPSTGHKDDTSLVAGLFCGMFIGFFLGLLVSLISGGLP